MGTRIILPSNRVWSSAGYSRAIRAGDLIEVAGTTASTADGEVLFPGDLFRQTEYVLEKIISAVEALGGQAADVVRTRVALTDIGRWKEAASAHAAVFAVHPPASAFYGVAGLLDSRLMIEVEATAVLGYREATVLEAE